MRYDAFISYRHGGLDGMVAERLHRLLETYRIPPRIAKTMGRKRLSRVFRDRDELPTSPNLSESIHHALRDSEWLIVVCSPRLLESIWCMQEVDVFSQIHGKDRILALLVDGEPAESFPEQMTFQEVDGERVSIEPLAADVRADTPRQSMRLLKGETLRIIAPILGCTYDKLKQRHKERFVRRLAVSIGMAFTLSLGFGGFAQYQYMRIHSEMQQKLVNQSLVLSEYSKRTYEEGDADTAMLLALSALPGDVGRPYVPEAESALASALQVYDAADGYRFHKYLELPKVPSELILSPDGRTTAAHYKEEVRLIDSETGKTKQILPIATNPVAECAFLEDGTFIYAGMDGLTALDSTDAHILWTANKATCVSVSGDRIAALDESTDSIYLYDGEGETVNVILLNGFRQRTLPQNALFNPHENAFALNADASLLVASFESGTMKIWDVSVSGGQEVAEMEHSGVIAWNAVFSDSYLALTGEYEAGGGVISVYDTDSWELIHSDESEVMPFVTASEEEALYITGYKGTRVFRKDGETRLTLPSGSAIIAIAVQDGNLLAAADNGSYFFVRAEDGAVTEYVSSYDCNLLDVKGGYALTGSYSSRSFRILRHTENDERNLLNYDSDYGYVEARINPNGDRAVFYSPQGFRVYEASGELITDVALPDSANVYDQRYDGETGNLAVIYGDKHADVYDADGKRIGSEQVETIAGLDIHTVFDKILIEVSGEPLDKETNFIGGVRTESGYLFAMSDGGSGSVYEIRNGMLNKKMGFDAMGGLVNAYFTSQFVLIASPIGSANVYDLRTGRFVREFEYKDGYFADLQEVDGILSAQFIQADSRGYALILDASSFSEKAKINGFCGLVNGMLVSDIEHGKLRAMPVCDLEELEAKAKEELGDRVLTTQEEVRYHIQ